jgi:transcriptional regulator with XRE-family HTH domain
MHVGTSTWRSALAGQLADYRRRHGLSQRALARELGLPHSTVTRLELGEHEPRVSTLAVLAEVLNRDLSLQIRPGEPVKMPDPRRTP